MGIAEENLKGEISLAFRALCHQFGEHKMPVLYTYFRKPSLSITAKYLIRSIVRK